MEQNKDNNIFKKESEKPKNVLVVGNDNRFLFLKKIMHQKDFKVFSLSFNLKDIVPFETKTENKNIKPETDKNLIKNFDIIVLPIMYGSENIKNNILKYINKNTVVFGGKLPNDINYGCEIFDYFLYEPLTIKNAAVTAEGAVAEAVINSSESMIGSCILITGYGRIAKNILNMLTPFSKNITVAARKDTDRAYINALGFNAVDFKNLMNDINGKNKANEYKFIFNTVPHLIFNSEILKQLNKNCLIIDLASAPGGVDFKFAENIGIKAVHSLSLPGKYAPETAAQLIYSCIDKKIKGEI